MPGCKAVCFDLFHTLVNVGDVAADKGAYTADILGVCREAWNRACFGELHEIRRPARHIDTVRTLAHSLDPGIPEERIRLATETRQRRFDHALQSVDGEVLATLRALRQRGLRLALVSNASQGEVQGWEHSPLAGLFDMVTFSWSCGHAKPEAAIYRHALEGLGHAAEECLFVGDGGSDELAGARRAGLQAVFLTRHVRYRLGEDEIHRRTAAAHHVIHDLAELLELLPDSGQLASGL